MVTRLRSVTQKKEINQLIELFLNKRVVSAGIYIILVLIRLDAAKIIKKREKCIIHAGIDTYVSLLFHYEQQRKQYKTQKIFRPSRRRRLSKRM